MEKLHSTPSAKSDLFERVTEIHTLLSGQRGTATPLHGRSHNLNQQIVGSSLPKNKENIVLHYRADSRDSRQYNYELLYYKKDADGGQMLSRYYQFIPGRNDPHIFRVVGEGACEALSPDRDPRAWDELLDTVAILEQRTGATPEASSPKRFLGHLQVLDGSGQSQ